MHIYMITRGIKNAVDVFINQLSAKYLHLPMKNKKTGKIYNIPAQVSVRPVQFWEVVFPKEQLDVILTTLFPDGITGPNHTKPAQKFQKFVNILRRFMKLKPIPKDWKKDKKMLVMGEAVERIAVGIKDDLTLDYVRPKEVYEKLGLPKNGNFESEGL